MKNKLVLIFIAFIFVSCGKDSPLFNSATTTTYAVEPAVEEDYTYEFTTYRCTTGEQAFSTLAEACEGLKDSELNNGCAEAQRQELFESAQCSGNFS